MKNILFLSVSGLSDALDQRDVTQDDSGSAILFVNHARSQFRPMDSDMYVAASGEGAVAFLDRADRERRISWAHQARTGCGAASRSWRQLNGFLRKHGLNPVSKDGPEYTTGNARKRVAAANPGLRVFS